MKVFVRPSIQLPTKPVLLKSGKIYTPEFLSKDMLEEEFMKTLKPIYFVQKLLGSCRVDARNRFISTPTPLQKVYTVILVFISIIINGFIFKTFYPRVEDVTVYGLIITSISIHLLLYICSIIYGRFLHGFKNVNFFLKMQKIDRLMKIDKNKQIYITLRTINYISGISIFTVYLVIFIVAVINNDLEFLAFVVVALNQFTFLVELLTCSGFVVYFVARLTFINGILINHLKANSNRESMENVTKTKKTILNRDIIITKIALDTHDFVSCDTSIYLRKLFQCFESFQNLYRFQIFVFSLKLVFMSLIVFELLLFSIQKNKIFQLEIISLMIFNIIDIFVAIVTGYRFELFYGKVKETKRLSIGIMSIHQSGELREKARTMLKMIEETPPKFSIYDMWEMNAGILLTIFSLVTSLIVTLLQFAFL